MSRRLFILISLAVVLLVAIGIAVWSLWSSRVPEAVPAEPVTSGQSSVPSEPNPIQPATTEPKPVDGVVLNLQQTAMAFAEGYGSYSTDAPFENLKALDRFFTSAFRQKVEQTITAGQDNSAPFYSSTTRALIADITDQNDSLATVVVQVQREERFSRDEPARLSYQKLLLSLARNGKSWLVDSAKWENSKSVE